MRHYHHDHHHHHRYRRRRRFAFIFTVDITVICRLYIATRHWNKTRANSVALWDLLKVYFVDLKSRLKNTGCEDSTPEDILEQKANTSFVRRLQGIMSIFQRRKYGKKRISDISKFVSKLPATH